MIHTVNSLPRVWSLFAYGVLMWGLIVGLLFVTRYVFTLPWRRTAEGRHLVSMTMSIVAFFLIYLVQAVVPDWWWRPYLMVVLLVALVANLTWRWIMLERHLRVRRRDEQERSLRDGDDLPDLLPAETEES